MQGFINALAVEAHAENAGSGSEKLGMDIPSGSLLWPGPCAFLRWPPWAHPMFSRVAVLSGLAAVVMFYAMPEGSKREYLAHAGRAVP